MHRDPTACGEHFKTHIGSLIKKILDPKQPLLLLRADDAGEGIRSLSFRKGEVDVAIQPKTRRG